MDPALTQLLSKKPGLTSLVQSFRSVTLKTYAEGLSTDIEMATRLHNLLETKTGVSISPKTILHTADHIGLMHHPFFWGTKVFLKEPVIVLATSNISPSNSSYPRALSWHDKELSEKRASFLSLKWRHGALYGVPALSKIEWSTYCITLPDKISAILRGAFSESLFAQKWLSSQLCTLSEHLWRSTIPNQEIHYLELEEIVLELLSEQLRSEKGAFWELCTSPQLQRNYIENFVDIPSAHAHDLSHGSHFFWHIENEGQKRQKIVFENGELRTESGIAISFQPEVLLQLLEKRRLLPTLGFCYGLLAGEYGATLAGGFSQIDYLPELLLAWEKTFDTCLTPPTTIFSGELGVVTIKKDHQLLLATLVDLLLYTDENERKELLEQSSSTTIEQSLAAIAPQLLHCIDASNLTPQTVPTCGVLHV